jgi:AcrR family transcriptional regulator
MHTGGVKRRRRKSAATLGSRLEPTQSRAKKSVELILATTAALLDEVGVEGFNTNLLAQRAGVRVRTVYRYFPNKYAVIMALTEALAVQWNAWMVRCYERLADPNSEWRHVLHETRVEWLKNAQRVPGALSVLLAMNATPELKELHFGIFEDMSQKIAAALRARGLRVPRVKLIAIARTVVCTMNVATELFVRLDGGEGWRLVAELDAAQAAYLERYLDPPSPRKSK